MVDLTDILSAVTDTVRNLKPMHAEAVLVRLRKGAGTGQWERAGPPITKGWKVEAERIPNTQERQEVLTLFESDEVTESVVLGIWSAFDIVKPDGSFLRYTKKSRIPINAFARKWRFLVIPNSEDKTPTPS